MFHIKARQGHVPRESLRADSMLSWHPAEGQNVAQQIVEKKGHWAYFDDWIDGFHHPIDIINGSLPHFHGIRIFNSAINSRRYLRLATRQACNRITRLGKMRCRNGNCRGLRGVDVRFDNRTRNASFSDMVVHWGIRGVGCRSQRGTRVCRQCDR
jgi:hypothetical protein